MSIRDLLDNRGGNRQSHDNFDNRPQRIGYLRRFCGQFIIACLIFGGVVYCYDKQNSLGEGVRFVVAMATANDNDFLAVNGDILPDIDAKTAEDTSTMGQGVKDAEGRLMMILPTSGLMERSFGELNAEGNTDDGIDILCTNDEPVKAAAAGQVTDVKKVSSGSEITIKHDTMLVSKYSGLTEAAVKVGDNLRQGQVIGNIVADSKKTVLLHFAVYENDLAVDPFLYLNGPEK